MPHSYSSWSTYNQCPAKYNYSYNLKLPRRPMGPAADRGTAIHDSVEGFMLRTREDLHPDIQHWYGQWMLSLRSTYQCEPEVKWSLNKKWEPTEWDARDCYVRGAFDLRIPQEENVTIYEWKTGRVYDEHVEQKFLYGTVGLVLHPSASRVTVRGVYFDQKESPPPVEYKRADLLFMLEEWDKRFKRIEREKAWPPNPNFTCRFCDFSKGNGGPCSF